MKGSLLIVMWTVLLWAHCNALCTSDNMIGCEVMIAAHVAHGGDAQVCEAMRDAGLSMKVVVSSRDPDSNLKHIIATGSPSTIKSLPKSLNISLLFEYSLIEANYYVSLSSPQTWPEGFDQKTNLRVFDGVTVVRTSPETESSVLELLDEVHHIPEHSISCSGSAQYNEYFRSLRENLNTEVGISVNGSDDRVADLVARVNVPQLTAYVRYLTGEASDLVTRNTYSSDAVKASAWLSQQFTSYGFSVSTQNYRSGLSNNVAAVLPGVGDPRKILVVGAHYDSRGPSSTSPTERAPGANDDATGVAMLLQVAKIISDTKSKFSFTIHLVAFSGEEQGLLGSQAYANLLYKNGSDVLAMLQADMMGYKPASQSQYYCGWPRTYCTPDLTELAISITNKYVPNCVTGRNSRCCSDHQSFFELGYPATKFDDTHGPIIDPEYHKSGDVSNRQGFDFVQHSLVVKSMMATIALLANLL